MNCSSQNEYYSRDSKIIGQYILNQKKQETQISSTKSPLKEKRKFNNDYEGTINNSQQIKQNTFVNRVRIALQPMFKTSVQKHGVIKHVLSSTERIHSESQKHHQNQTNKRSERNIFYNKLISSSTKQSNKKIKQKSILATYNNDYLSRADLTYLQNSEIKVKPNLIDTSLQITHYENKQKEKNKYQIISYAKKEEKQNILNQTENLMIDEDNISEQNVIVFKSKKKS